MKTLDKNTIGYLKIHEDFMDMLNKDNKKLRKYYLSKFNKFAMLIKEISIIKDKNSKRTLAVMIRDSYKVENKPYHTYFNNIITTYIRSKNMLSYGRQSKKI